MVAGAGHRPWWPITKLAITAALLYLALRRIDVGGALRALGALRGTTVAAIVVLTALQAPIAAERWRRMLRALTLDVPRRSLIADYLVGQAFNLLLPSTVGGDVVRAMRCAGRRPGHASEVWLSVLLERLIGLLSVGALPLFAILILGGRAGLPRLIVPVSAAVTLLTFVALLVAHHPLRLVAARLPGRLTRVAAELTRWADGLRRISLATKLEIMGWSLLMQLLSLGLLAIAVRDLADSGAVRAVALGVPLIWVLSTVPITIGGFGLRESLFIGVLGALGVAAPAALALSMVWLGQQLVTATAGLIVHLAGGVSRPPVPPAPAA